MIMKKLWIQFKAWLLISRKWLSWKILNGLKWLFNKKWFHLISVMFAFVGGLVGWLGMAYIMLYLIGFGIVDINKDK